VLTKQELREKCNSYCQIHREIKRDAGIRGFDVDDNGVLNYAMLLSDLPEQAKGRSPKPAPKKKAKKKASKPKKKAAAKPNPRAAEGRRAQARGDRPPLKQAIAVVMGKATMDAATVVKALKARGWLPNAEDPHQYASFMLSSSRDVFERVRRGFYRVKAQPKLSPATVGAAVLSRLNGEFVRDDLLAKRLMKAPELSFTTPDQAFEVVNRLVKQGKITQRTRNHHREWAKA